jgi:hypothetical protein
LHNPNAETAVEASQEEMSGQAPDIPEDLATDPSLWDKAYDALKDEKHDLIAKYENLLSRVLKRGKSSVKHGLLQR